MKTDLYIPATIVVGFQKRTDTFTGKLAYVIYKDHTGKLRKEASWNSWRHKDIETIEVSNDATQGFTFNKGVRRDGYWGNGRSVIRVWDPRDFEFEISVDNLVGILMHSDVSKRDVVEKCVFAWAGTELLLLPCNSMEYTESVKHTEKQAQKIGAKELKIGATYTLKKEHRQVVYLGRFDRYETEHVYAYGQYYGPRASTHQIKKTPKKNFVFIDPNTLLVEVKDPLTFLAYCDLEEMHPNFATLMEEYWKSVKAQPVVGLAIAEPDTSKYGHSWWKQIGENQFIHFEVSYSYTASSHTGTPIKFEKFARFNEQTMEAEFSYDGRNDNVRYGYYSSGNQNYPPRYFPEMTKDRADLVTLLEEMNKDWIEMTQPFVGKGYYDIDREHEKQVKSEFQKKYNLSSLNFKLQNGVVAKDNEL